MSTNLKVSEYNLVLIPGATSGPGTLNFASTDLEPVLTGIFVTDDGNRIVSPADQISILLSPPSLGVVDHAGVPPVRERFLKPVEGIVRLLDAQHFAIGTFGWNIMGTIGGRTPAEAMRKLISEERIDSVMSERSDREWSVPLIQFSAESDVAERITISLQTIQGEASPELGFSMNAHFERQLLLDDVAQSADNVWAEAESLLKSLLR